MFDELDSNNQQKILLKHMDMDDKQRQVCVDIGKQKRSLTKNDQHYKIEYCEKFNLKYNLSMKLKLYLHFRINKTNLYIERKRDRTNYKESFSA